MLCCPANHGRQRVILLVRKQVSYLTHQDLYVSVCMTRYMINSNRYINANSVFITLISTKAAPDASDSPRKLYVFLHKCNSLCVDSA